MASLDAGVPQDLSYRGRVALDDSDDVVRRERERASGAPWGQAGAYPESRTEYAKVYTGENGAVVYFDLGDGDGKVLPNSAGDEVQQSQEVAWALETFLDNQEDFSMPDFRDGSGDPVAHNIIAAAYYTAPTSRCATDPDPEAPKVDGDHQAVQRAAWRTPLRDPDGTKQVRYRAAPVCADHPYLTDSDSGNSRVDVVSAGDWATLLAGDSRAQSPYQRRFGWLQHGLWPYTTELTQSKRFHRKQYFWVRRCDSVDANVCRD